MEFRKLSKGRKKEIHSLLSIPKHYTLGRVVNVSFKYLETQGMLNTDRSFTSQLSDTACDSSLLTTSPVYVHLHLSHTTAMGLCRRLQMTLIESLRKQELKLAA